MKLKAYHSFIIFAVLVMSAIFSSVSSYRKAQYAIVKDMNQALAQTIEERQDQWITPDTIQSYRSHLSIDMLKSTSILCYAIGKPAELCSKEMQLDKHTIQGYANCSMADIFGMSNQRTSFILMLMAMIWAAWAMLYHRKDYQNEEYNPLSSEASPIHLKTIAFTMQIRSKPSTSPRCNIN